MVFAPVASSILLVIGLVTDPDAISMEEAWLVILSGD